MHTKISAAEEISCLQSLSSYAQQAQFQAPHLIFCLEESAETLVDCSKTVLLILNPTIRKKNPKFWLTVKIKADVRGKDEDK